MTRQMAKQPGVWLIFRRTTHSSRAKRNRRKMCLTPSRGHPLALSIIAILAAAVTFIHASPAQAEDASPSRVHEIPITADDRDHWAFQPLERPQPPQVENTSWPRTPIDQFILARLEDDGLAPAPMADRATLARRLWFNLLGLPPSRDDVRRFAGDDSPDAYERLVDRLLASPHYGERWAQHWLDLARFAETDGYEHDKVRPLAWKYRDWVIAALNDDMPYDQFVQWQIAGDLLEPDNPDAATATAFCLSGPDMPDINSQDERRHMLLNEMTSTVGAVLLGLQMGCAQCHDHMYDPVSQADFYRLRAFFEPAVELKRDRPVTVLASTSADARSHVMIRGDWRRPGVEVPAAFPRIADPWETPLGDDALPERAMLARWITRGDHPLAARVIVNRVWQYHFGRGLSETPSDFGLLGDEPSHPELLDWLATELVASGWRLKSLHRLILTSAVYRQASRLPESARADDRWRASLEQDADAALLSRFPRRRLEAEVIRDAMLSVSGSLSAESGGPGVMPPLPEELLSTLLKNQWQTSPHEADHHRRSIYLFARRNLRFPMFEAFDRPAANESCARRQPSTTALQSLLMLNSAAALDAARRLAGAVWDEAGDDPSEQVNAAVWRAFSREPTRAERDELVEFLRRQRALLEAESRPADSLATPLSTHSVDDYYAGASLADLCLALLNSSEFVYVD